MALCSRQYLFLFKQLNHFSQFNPIFSVINNKYLESGLKVSSGSLLIPLRTTFWEPDQKGGYKIKDETPLLTHLKEGPLLLLKEFKLWIEEKKEYFRFDPKYYVHGDTEVIWRFDSQEKLKKWKVAADKDNAEGFSEGQLKLNKNGKALFSGVIDITPPKTGKIKRAGYCAIKSIPLVKSFQRMDQYDWTSFTHLVMRVRGDGRNYALSLSISRIFDIVYFDMYTFILYTHGGPYWQTAKIPFSKFFLTSKGKVQDKQIAVPLDKVRSLVIMCAEVPGPFQLEIDYIGVYSDYNHTEEFAYELYDIPKDIVRTG